MINLNQLWIFHNVAKYKSFTRAAEESYLTQPSVSTQVKLLENAYKIKLFERFGKKIELTNAGEALYSYTEKIFNLIREVDSIIQDIKGIKSGTIKVSTSLTLATYYLPNFLKAFKMKYPNIEIQMTAGNTREVMENILTFKSDLGFIGNFESHEKLVITPFSEEELVIIVHPSHEFSGRNRIHPSKLDGQPFILREQGSGTREVVEQALKRNQVAVRVVMELGTNEVIKKAVEAGLGISIVPINLVKREIEEGLLKAIRLSKEDILRKFYMIYHKDKHITNLIKTFLQMALEFSPPSVK
jgi:DNA-binding transcriptional LysR family regulator